MSDVSYIVPLLHSTLRGTTIHRQRTGFRVCVVILLLLLLYSCFRGASVHAIVPISLLANWVYSFRSRVLDG